MVCHYSEHRSCVQSPKSTYLKDTYDIDRSISERKVNNERGIRIRNIFRYMYVSWPAYYLRKLKTQCDGTMTLPPNRQTQTKLRPSPLRSHPELLDGFAGNKWNSLKMCNPSYIVQNMTLRSVPALYNLRLWGPGNARGTFHTMFVI